MASAAMWIMRRLFHSLVKWTKWIMGYADVTNTLTNIVNLKSRLPDIIEPEFGFLDELFALGVLTARQYEDVSSERGAAYRSKAVLNMLVTEDQSDKFLQALQRTGQQHAINFITHNGGQKHCIIKSDNACEGANY